MKDADGKAVLVNTGMISIARKAEGDRTGIVLRIAGEEIHFPQGNIEEMKKNLSNDTGERIASNLFHIWEILRARLR